MSEMGNIKDCTYHKILRYLYMESFFSKEAETAIIPRVIIAIKFAPFPSCEITVTQLDCVLIYPKIISI